MGSSLLSTRQAAERLGVSEASVRRWSDRGALPVQRVGKRGERRFKAEHLSRFAPPGRQALPQVTPDSPTVVLGGQAVKLSTHVAAFYNSDEARVRLTAPFLAEGITAGQPCFLLAHGEQRDSYMKVLGELLAAELDAALVSGLLIIADAPGRTAREALEFWEQALWDAVDRHAVAIRIVGEMASVREVFASEQEMLTFEAMFNTTAKRFPCVVICQYDVRKFSGEAVLSALRAHPDMADLPLGLLLK
jgi:excisionase family DNA binding protein